MNKPIHDFFTNDHHRLDKILNSAIADIENIDPELYHQFRTGLLKHIKMEEKVLFPAARKIDAAKLNKVMPRFRLEHGSLTALLVPPPNRQIINAIRHVLEKHDLAEEQPGGLYDICEALTSGQTQQLLDDLKKTEEVPVHPPNPHPVALESAVRALERAGYDYYEICK